MRAPDFWFNPPARPGWQARLLAPVGAVYARATARRVAHKGARVSCPVICVGNINAGGTGKTPTVIALAQRLQAAGLNVHAVSKGYGGTLEGPEQVDERRHRAAETGDEPLLLAAFLPVWVAKDRLAGCRAAAGAGAEVIVLDDGHQNPAVEKDLSLVVVDAGQGFGNARCIPAGPLREPVEAGLARADAVLSIGPSDAQIAFEKQWGSMVTLPHMKGALIPLQMGMDWTGMRCIAFAGIGQPAKFFRTLKGLGAEIIEAHALDDHQALSPALLNRLIMQAKAKGAQLVTTEKDAVRLPMELRAQVISLPVRLELEDWTTLDRLIETLMERPA
ncbi:tetraacyldisaccharide 4'-kinase [Aquicoccus sp. G2-2]|uniref:tetraacyldisaccharide 4'-kinase n=1 Tax=Aquicoccus sp. G2-2 TaxID=3092120 RepID=UPI002AE0772F|nr:tetraacyldisaccharide 4'-kinase [Aquicoccus sp. G2-2]MEA1114905.1 tetraacyldisaccharide 4'-kinase [Aquicoccus sp. G2-2]